MAGTFTPTSLISTSIPPSPVNAVDRMLNPFDKALLTAVPLNFPSDPLFSEPSQNDHPNLQTQSISNSLDPENIKILRDRCRFPKNVHIRRPTLEDRGHLPLLSIPQGAGVYHTCHRCGQFAGEAGQESYLAIRPTEPEPTRVTRKRTREAAGFREGPSSEMTLSSTSSSPRSMIPVARVRTPGTGSGNVPLSKQLITSYGDKKYTPEEERKSAGLQDVPWGRLSVKPLPVSST
ncbi:hypothetical protein ACH5RR_021263 [Cinchona calisaya]|uniref:Uncharacterized protein n=1 Tax=Cinchona calisaya TaxID=153742 RepID=A0ABD2ZHU2_9GENT